jgi:hypothetical protein
LRAPAKLGLYRFIPRPPFHHGGRVCIQSIQSRLFFAFISTTSMPPAAKHAQGLVILPGMQQAVRFKCSPAGPGACSSNIHPQPPGEMPCKFSLTCFSTVTVKKH